MDVLQRDELDAPVRGLASLPKRKTPVAFSAWWTTVLVLSDLSVFAAASLAVAVFRYGGLQVYEHWYPLSIVSVALIAGWVALFARLGLYRHSFAASFRDEVYYTLAALTIGFAPLLLLFSLVPAISPSRSAMLEMLGVAAVGVSFTRSALHLVRSKLIATSGRRIAVVGAPERLEAVFAELTFAKNDSVLKLPVVDFDAGFASAAPQPAKLSDVEWLNSALAWSCDTLIVTEAIPPAVIPELLRRTEAAGVKLAMAPTRIRLQAYDFTIQKDGGLALICPRSLSICTPAAHTYRRIIDVALVALSSVVVAPVFGLIALAVYLDSGAPIFYRQTRVGRFGRPFEMLKFRSMPVDAEAKTGPVWASPAHDRATRIGRFLRRTSLDELPQLVNVLRGDMGIVGPRPERPFYVEKFRRLLPRYDERHLVRPGITGWAQIHMRRSLDVSAIGDKLSYDLFYLENWSPLIDVTILVKTAIEFLFHRPT